MPPARKCVCPFTCELTEDPIQCATCQKPLLPLYAFVCHLPEIALASSHASTTASSMLPVEAIEQRYGSRLADALRLNLSDSMLNMLYPGYICTMRYWSIPPLTFGLLLYYMSLRRHHILLWCLPALEAARQVRRAAPNNPFNMYDFWNSWICWDPNRNIDSPGTWSLMLLQQLIRRCEFIASNRLDPTAVLLLDPTEGACVQCSYLCSTLCPHCEAFLCAYCTLPNVSHRYCELAGHSMRIAGDDF